MKKSLIAIILFFAISSNLQSQDETSLFELKLYNSQNKLVTGKNVDLYQGANKIYDLTESSSIPGVYSATVLHGEYDIYVNTSLWKSGVWIGSNKISLVVNMFDIDAGANNDTLTVDGHIQADSFSGDGSGLTGIVGSIGESTGDLIIGADSDANGSGELIMRTRTIARGRFTNDGRMLLGHNSSNITGSLITNSAISIADDDSDGVLLGLGITPATSTSIFSNVNGSGSYLPLAFWTGGLERMRLGTTGNLGLGISTAPQATFHINTVGGSSFRMTSDGLGATSLDGFRIAQDDVTGDVSIANYEDGKMLFGNNGADHVTLYENGGLTVGSPTGGSQGIGTINASAIYDDGVLITGGSNVWDRIGTNILPATRSDSVTIGTANAKRITFQTSSGEPSETFFASDGDNFSHTINTSDQSVFQNAGGGYFFDTDASNEIVRLISTGLRINYPGAPTGDPIRTLHIQDNASTANGIRVSNSDVNGDAILELNAGTSTFQIKVDNTIANDPFVISGSEPLLTINPTSDIFTLGSGNSDAGQINTFVIGKGDNTTGTLNSQTIRGTNASTSSTNKASADFNCVVGLPTGNAASGFFNIKTAQTGSSGTTLQTARTRAVVGFDNTARTAPTDSLFNAIGMHLSSGAKIDGKATVKRLSFGDTSGVVLTALGAATLSSSNQVIDTFGAVALDTLVTLTGAIGDVAIISTRNSGRDIAVLNSGNFLLGTEVLLSDPADKLMVIAITTTTWRKLSFSDNQ